MQKVFLSFAIILLFCCGCTPSYADDTYDTVTIDRVGGLSYSMEEGTEVNLADFVSVAGGQPPYTYSFSTAVDSFVPELVVKIPPAEEYQAVYAIYARDSRGRRNANPFQIKLTITERSITEDKTLAFPEAGGGGRFTTGGRGGNVVYVTNLDDGPYPGPEGSLRYALTRPAAAKTIMFKVSGEIKLKSALQIRSDGSNAAWGKNITIAGESAPGDGICVTGYPFQILNAENIIIRFMRFRLGDENRIDGDAAEGRTSSNVILDQCSFSWGIDEQASFYAMRNFTMQWCVITEALRQSYSESGGPHGYNGIWGGQNCSYHHNMITRCDSRNPRPGHLTYYDPVKVPFDLWGGFFDIRNNLIYGWGMQVAYGGEGQQFNMVGNTYMESEKSTGRDYFFQAYYETEPVEGPAFRGAIYKRYPSIYMNGNEYYKWTASGPQAKRGINDDNYSGIDYYGHSALSAPKIPAPPLQEFRITGVRGSAHTVTHSASEARTLVLARAGAWPRDKVDSRAATDARDRTLTYGGTMPSAVSFNRGMIDSPANVGGIPTYKTTTAPVDTDGDGLPDEWETFHKLDPNDPADGRAYSSQSRYTNLEIYLHELAAELIGNKKSNNY